MSRTDDEIRRAFEPAEIEWAAEHWRRTYPDTRLEVIDRGYLRSFALWQGDRCMGCVDQCGELPQAVPYWYAKTGPDFSVWINTSCDLNQALSMVYRWVITV